MAAGHVSENAPFVRERRSSSVRLGIEQHPEYRRETNYLVLHKKTRESSLPGNPRNVIRRLIKKLFMLAGKRQNAPVWSFEGS